MNERLAGSLEQMAHLAYEVRLLTNKRWWRWLTCWLTTPFWAVASYRVSRACYLLLGRGHVVLRFALSPLLFLLRPWFGGQDIHYRADIGRGLLILHPALGVVVSGHTRAGKDLILTGGNCIGVAGTIGDGELVIGDNVTLGANAVILGPIRVGNNVWVGAGAVVTRNAGDDQVLVGVPAVPLPGRGGRPDA
jgi:serine O-acetyltransferase